MFELYDCMVLDCVIMDYPGMDYGYSMTYAQTLAHVYCQLVLVHPHELSYGTLPNLTHHTTEFRKFSQLTTYFIFAVHEFTHARV